MPAVPPLSAAAIQAVQDPNTRSILRAIADGMAIRNGDKGDGQQAFLTLADLKDSKIAKQVSDAVAQPIIAGLSNPQTPAGQLADSLKDAIFGSPEWHAMFARLELVAAPSTEPGSPAWLLMEEAKARGAAVRTITQAVQATNESLASTKTTLTTAIGDNLAAIQTEATARSTADSALTEQVQTVVTQTAQSFAGVKSTLTTHTNNDNALAKAINFLWAQVGNNKALINSGSEIAVNSVGSAVTKFDQLQSVVTDPITGLVDKAAALRQEMNTSADAVKGLQGKWGVKIDLDGYVTGASLNSSVSTGGKAESSFIILASKFALGAPGKPNTVPFAIDTDTGLAMLHGNLVVKGSIDTAQLKALSVKRDQLALQAVGGAQIDKLAVDTLHIAGNAVTVPVATTVTRTIEGMGMAWNNWIEAVSGTITLPEDGMVFAATTALIAYGDGWRACETRLDINGATVSYGGGASSWVNASHSGGRKCKAGKVTAALYFRADPGARLMNPTLFIQGTMK